MKTEAVMARFVPPGPLGMGGAPLGNLYSRIPEQDALDAVEAAWEAGIRFYDTAPHYGAGLSEHRMGHVLRSKPRDALVLATKVGRLLVPDASVPAMADNFERALPFRRVLDYSADGARRSIEDSLQRLGMDRIDIVFIHDVSEDHLGARWTEVFGEAMRGAAVALTRLREEGTIRAWGLGVNLVEPCLHALEQSDPDLFLLAGQYSLLRTTGLDALLPRCVERGVKIVVGGPYNSGLLAGGTTFDYERAPPEMVEKTRRIASVCERFGVPLKAAALQFCTAHPAVAAAIPGARTAAEVRDNAAMAQVAIPPGLWAALRQEGLLPAAAPVPGG
jgi:D-threo-aldose 1-dehydrogenase